MSTVDKNAIERHYCIPTVQGQKQTIMHTVKGQQQTIMHTAEGQQQTIGNAYCTRATADNNGQKQIRMKVCSKSTEG